MRILIVEDNRRLAESVRDLLKQIWYDSDVCTDGISGAYLLEEGTYDAAILDIMLPGKDGLTILKEARAKGCRIPVLLLTAKSETEDRGRGLEGGADSSCQPGDGHIKRTAPTEGLGKRTECRR